MNDASGSPQEQAAGLEIDRLIHEPARLNIMLNLFVVESADYVFLMNQTGLSWGNLSVQITRLEECGYLLVEKGYRGRKPHSMVSMTETGREAFKRYRSRMKAMLDDLPGS